MQIPALLVSLRQISFRQPLVTWQQVIVASCQVWCADFGRLAGS